MAKKYSVKKPHELHTHKIISPLGNGIKLRKLMSRPDQHVNKPKYIRGGAVGKVLDLIMSNEKDTWPFQITFIQETIDMDTNVK